jgi:hypothetical protein
MDVGQERELMALVMGGFSQNGRSPHGTFSSTKLGDSKTIPSFYKKIILEWCQTMLNALAHHEKIKGGQKVFWLNK